MSYWTQTPTALGLRSEGLTPAQAAERLLEVGVRAAPHRFRALRLLVNQFKSPLVVILIFAACVSLVAGEWVDALVVIVVIVGSAILSFIQEYNASSAVDQLLARIQITSNVLRAGQVVSVPASAVVPGDLVLLAAGNLIPGDGVLVTAKDFYVDQASLTGESYPVAKQPGILPENTPLAERTNSVFAGTSVRSGTATALIVQTGDHTAYGQIAARLQLSPPPTEFERGIRRFGYLLIQIILLLVLFVFAVNVFTAKPAVESLLFALALAVGIAPELLPAIITITLSKGAQAMAQHGVIVRRLNAIENFGNMDVLCTDKTGTLTEGAIRLNDALDAAGQPSASVLLDAALNASLQMGMANPLDTAIIAATQHLDLSGYTKIDEIAYDFERRRLSVIVAAPTGEHRIITKGALDEVLDVCNEAGLDRPALMRLSEQWNAAGFRLLGVATKTLTDPARTRFTLADESDLTFRGLLLFYDPPKAHTGAVLNDLTRLGVQVKIITGDSLAVTRYVARQVGLVEDQVLTGAQLQTMRDEALWPLVERTNLFAEVDPNQKERIIRALQRTGHVVGYLGDGINDAPALHVADVGISVDSAVDVAKQAADFVLLEHSLSVLRDGIVFGRRTFANTLKYVFTTTSANFGNMFSMAALSLFLPYLPLLAKQILLNNFLSDFPGLALATDSVDAEWVDQPHRWNLPFIRNFMIVFGLVSSAFDFLTFGVLLWLMNASPEQFRTGWFIESLLTELVIALVVRTRRPLWRSRPGKWLFIATLLVAGLTLLLPYVPPVNTLFEFVPLPLPVMLVLVGITALYVVAAELTKRVFYARWSLT